ncbi:expressed unknown protein [Seminavis robusta]|uniref:Uncharacterized protein n=1 Tax=Seminavis robusta TaxID=568900 RepID=A0A9N8DHN3_9STRA|nr:expressed unknown protein [Seminavis robusta]|eukprot:Sro93_g048340.1 n/a (316) ;mRNA; r:23157-24104
MMASPDQPNSDSKATISSSTKVPPTERELQVQQRELARLRQLFKNSNWQLLRDKWPLVREDCGEAWKTEPEDCQVEKQIIREHVEVFEHGVVMSLVVFATLRIVAHPRFEPLAERYIKPIFTWGLRSTKRKAPKKKADTTTTNTTADKQKPKLAQLQQRGRLRQFKSHLEKQRDSHVERVHQAAEAPHDFLVSTIVGASATFLFFQPAQLRLDFEEAPLMPGKSFWCDHMCQDAITIYQNTDPKVFQYDESETPDANVKSFEKFALHCILRSAYIQKRKQQGEAKPNVLPTSGPWELPKQLNDETIKEGMVLSPL